MKILHVINTLGPGGAEKLVVEMCNHLSENQHEVGLFTFVSEIDFFESRLSSSVKYYKNVGKSYFSIRKIIRLYQIIKEYEVIHVHLFPSFYIIAIVSLFLKKRKFVYTEHNSFNKRRKRIYRPIERFIYNRYSKITCISNGVYTSLRDWINAKSELQIVNNFIDVDKIRLDKSAERSFFGYEKDDRIIAMVGSFHNDQKDQKTVLLALYKLPSNFKLIFIGDGSRRQDLEFQVRNSDISNRVSFLGNRNDVYEILKFCDYGVLSSKWEGFGLVALEYIACGLISIGTNVIGLNEVITETDCLFEFEDHESLEKIIMTFENDEDLRSKTLVSQNSRLHDYDIVAIMNQFIAIYNS